MKFEEKNPPRLFPVGNSIKFDMADCGELHLNPDEQVTFVTEKGGEYDVARKDWGFYATPSLNGRLPSFGLRAVLIKNRDTLRFFVLMVESGHEASFKSYCEQENLAIICWMDNDQALQEIEAKLVG
ncbi:hypothetical protein [Kiloniella majae]|uniref:hypothetical protein n=1 Tax=Kiloniella majae TaxID=1938558 RepID=UPI000A27978C|nr:hypothetical protein [Kiloniella majae]